MPGEKIGEHNGAAPALLQFRPDHGVLGIVGAFDQKLGPDRLDQLDRRILVEDADQIDRGKARKYRGPRGLGLDRAGRPLEPPHAGIAVEPNHEPIAGRAGLLQQMDVARMKQIEAAIGKASAPANPAPSLDLLGGDFAGHDLTKRPTLGR